MRSGGDGYAVFAETAQDAYDYGPTSRTWSPNTWRRNAPYQPRTDGRITAR